LIKEEDLPTLFQLTIAQESNSKQLEALADIIKHMQTELDMIKETLHLQHEILDMIVSRGHNENSRN